MAITEMLNKACVFGSGLEILKDHYPSQVKKKENMYSTLDRVHSVKIPHLWFKK
jgi:hypothetical protein